MNQNKLSSLNTLNTFIAACETGNLKSAAIQLKLSASTVSRQIQTLEDELGFSLFDRMPNSLSITDKGQQFYYSTKKALSIIQDSIDNISKDGKTGILRLSVPPYFSKHWLMPRLSEFYKRFPDVKIQFEYRHTGNEFDPKLMDLSIRFDPLNDDSLKQIKLFNQYALPVASPALCKEFNLKKDIKNWAQCMWLKVNSSQDIWQQWLLAQNATHLEPIDVITFDDADSTIQAAVENMGIALVIWPMSNKLIEEGKLVPLCELSAALPNPYFMAFPHALENFAPLVSFRDWLIAEAQKEELNVKEMK